MKCTTYLLTVLTCLAVTSLSSARAEDAKANKTEPLLPSQNQTVDCPQYQNCTANVCHFDGTSTDTKNQKFLPDFEWIITCGSLKVDVKFPATKESAFMGNETYTCFQYSNGNGTTFSVAEVILSRPNDVKGGQVNCTFDGNKCTLQNETESQVVLVAGFPSSCTLWVPPPTVTTPAAPTTTMTTQSSVTPSDIPKTTGSLTTAIPNGTDTTTGGTTKAAGGTTSAPETTTKGSSDVARLEFASVLAMAAALLIRQYL